MKFADSSPSCLGLATQSWPHRRSATTEIIIVFSSTFLTESNSMHRAAGSGETEKSGSTLGVQILTGWVAPFDLVMQLISHMQVICKSVIPQSQARLLL